MRLLLCIIFLVLFGALKIFGRPQQTKPGCRYDGKRYQESSFVNTSEPCLHCYCYEGSLRCRLRVCPRIPNPLPSGCTTRIPHENACCAELICHNYHKKGISRMRNADPDLKTNGCIWEGVHYAPGSAMMGSRRCEYCYCISGERRCVRPKCLLPLPGCTPLYAPYSCCPVAYNCTHSFQHSTSSSANGCKIGKRCYKEGEMVRDIEWKTICDNCFCAMGGIRCVPLACAPPLQGCTPIVREGQCCPSTYNCSGSIAVKSTHNFASYAFISKDYAKFRKETNFLLPNIQRLDSTIEGRSHRDDDDSHTTEEAFEDESTISILDVTSSAVTYETETMDNEIPTESVDYPKSTGSAESITQSWTTSDQVIETTSINEITTGSSSSMAIDYRLTTVTDPSTVIDYTGMNEQADTTVRGENLSSPIESEKSDTSFEIKTKLEYLKLKEKNENFDRNETTEYTDIIFETTFGRVGEKVRGGGGGDGGDEEPSQEGVEGAVLMPADTLVMNVTLKTNVSVKMMEKITQDPVRLFTPDIERIINITDRKKRPDYEEYDYNEPTLPPSLPNVRIIPFVAADALINDKESPSPVTAYPLGSVGIPPELRPSDVTAVSGSPGNFYDIVTQKNHFSPPVETEGGFMPKEPSYYETQYHSTDLNLEIGMGVTVIPAETTNSHRKNDAITSVCRFDGRLYNHGELLPSSGHCIICICYYGEIVCSDEKCPTVKFGCQRIPDNIKCCGKIVCGLNAEEYPTVVLDRRDDSEIPLKIQAPSYDPFRDVIRTEPPPDLPSLIEDIIPYFEHRISTPLATFPSFNQQISLSNKNIEDKYEDVIITTEKSTNSIQTLLPAVIDDKNLEISTVKIMNDSSINYDKEANFLFDSMLDLVISDTTLPSKLKNSTISTIKNISTSRNNFSSTEIFLSSTENIVYNGEKLNLPVNNISTTHVATTVLHDGQKNSMISENITLNSNVLNEKSVSSGEEKDEEKILPVGGLLKLAGCNIYGRMYRVGRIIVELSTQCLECRCTDLGVQCKQLEC